MGTNQNILDCLTSLIDLENECEPAISNNGTFYGFSDISWFSNDIANNFIDSKYKTLNEFKIAMLKKAVGHLRSYILSFGKTYVTLNDTIGYFNNYSSTTIQCMENVGQVGLLATKRIGKFTLNIGAINIYTNNTVVGDIGLVDVYIDGGLPLQYQINFNGARVVSLAKLQDADFNYLSALENIRILVHPTTTAGKSIQFCKHDLPCQTGCLAGVSKCAEVVGIDNDSYSNKYTFGVECLLTCQCNFDAHFCSGSDSGMMAELVLEMLEFHIFDYAFSNGRTSLIKQDMSVIAAIVSAKKEVFNDKLERYVKPFFTSLLSEGGWGDCLTCNGISYGSN